MLEEMMLTAVELVRAYESALVRLGRMELAAPYLVECDGIPVTFDVDDAGFVRGVRPCMPHLARSFARDDAEALASVIANGDGVAGSVVHVRDSILRKLDAERAVVETLVGFGQAGAATQAGDRQSRREAKVASVMRAASCSRGTALDYLAAEEWCIDDALKTLRGDQQSYPQHHAISMYT